MDPQPDRRKPSYEKKQKSEPRYLQGIHNQRGGVKPEEPASINPSKKPGKIPTTIEAARIKKPEVKPLDFDKVYQQRQGLIQKPHITPRHNVTEEDIQAVLARNPSKRQNVAFLRGLLDSQLKNLSTNLRSM